MSDQTVYCETCKRIAADWSAAQARIRELEGMLVSSSTPGSAMRIRELEGDAARQREQLGQMLADIRQRDERIAELNAQAAAMRALLEPMLQPDIWWCPQCKMETGATHEERCVTCGHVFADNPPADAIRAALAPDAGRRVAEVVEAAMKVCRLLASIAENTAEEEVEFVQPGDKMISKGKVVLSRDDWDVVSEACRLAVSALDAGKEGGA